MRRQRFDNPKNLSPSGVGLRWVPVTHTGRKSYSPEEVQAVRHLVKHVISSSWTAQDGTVRRVGPQDIFVVSPFNVQVAEIQQAVSIDVAVGTDDKLQGQKAPIVMYTMACSSAQDTPPGFAFLYAMDRLNVAISRAQGMAIRICSTALMAPSCQTFAQMRWVNVLYRFIELAETVEKE